ncbi:hypothetical protein KL933_001532 [Ogataea haglerorum]|uniref:RRM domain-containing protein n=1 Tax=Ogataea haglerorum TaxID=1937702 RepID=A0AAN6D7N8_9ASCO|nr:hypothetical protein KL951_002635 [Ogataea haglerorum]KAG7729306.1 hypothetical protein KL933_001532 [Ogataea haglerorum]KAG7748858.1 hypothetical protein KL912_001920 [Ogataea haglerorum]KAG7766539.1 hypothetical protein KL946_001727 [Ogataea haglerorum]
MLQDQTQKQSHPRELSNNPSLTLVTGQSQMHGQPPQIFASPYASFSHQLPNGAQIINVPMSQQVPVSPTTPFDVNYAKGMLPRQLLVSSPFIQSPMAPGQAPSQSVHVDRASTRNSQSSIPTENNAHHQISHRGEFRRRSFSKQLKSNLAQAARAPKTTESSESSEHEHEEFETRSLRVINLRSDIGLTDVLDLIEYGPIENCSFELTPHSNNNKAIILSFVKRETAFNCYSELRTILDELRGVLESPEMELLPAKNVPLLPAVQSAIENDGATRAVCLSNLPSGLPLRLVYQELEMLGPIEHIKYAPNKNAAFVHFTSISTAIKCVEQLSLSETILSTAKVFYSKEKNATIRQSNGTANIEYDFEDDQYSDFYSTPSTSFSSPQNANIALQNLSRQATENTVYGPHYMQSLPTPILRPSYPPQGEFVDSYNGMVYSQQSLPDLTDLTLCSNGSVTNYSLPARDTAEASSIQSKTHFRQSNVGNRTIYLRNIHRETTAEEICNTVRGGLLESIKLIPDRHICYLSFIESGSAAQFFATSTKEKVVIHGRRVKVDWGKHSGPISSRVLQAVEKHSASRNLYIGTELVSEGTQEEDRPKIPDADTLRRDFSIFGEIEQINFFRDGQCAFVNFLDICSSINAVEDFNGEGGDAVHASFENRYKAFKIAYGKDRCANPPKSKKNKNRNRKKNQNDSKESFKKSSEDVSVTDDDALRKVPALKSIGISSKMYEEKHAIVSPVIEETDDEAGETRDESRSHSNDSNVEIITNKADTLKTSKETPKINNLLQECSLSNSSSESIPKAVPKTSQKSNASGNRYRVQSNCSRSSSNNSINYFNHSEQYPPQPQVQYHPFYQQPSLMYQQQYAFSYQPPPSAGIARHNSPSSRKILYHEPTSPAAQKFLYLQQPTRSQQIYYNYPEYYSYLPQESFYMESRDDDSDLGPQVESYN